MKILKSVLLNVYFKNEIIRLIVIIDTYRITYINNHEPIIFSTTSKIIFIYKDVLDFFFIIRLCKLKKLNLLKVFLFNEDRIF